VCGVSLFTGSFFCAGLALGRLSSGVCLSLRPDRPDDGVEDPRRLFWFDDVELATELPELLNRCDSWSMARMASVRDAFDSDRSEP
jgi:hypothetical protein